tara:strand:- start:96 stop:1070 length:975 start_codon:yes stop_codon:yes gene_type:complete
MIVKSFELKTKNFKNFKSVLLYGVNQGHKSEVIKENFTLNFKGEVLNLEESEILENQTMFVEKLMNKSLFDDEKLIIISRSTNKILKFIEEFLEKKIENVKLVVNAESLDKKSKLRSIFEKEKYLACIPFYEDNQQSLSIYANSFLNEKKIKISREIVNLVLERARGDRGNLKNELEKIEVLSITKKNFSTEDILKLTNLSENYNIFELVDNYLAKNQKKVSKIINENNFVNDDCILIIRTLLSRSKRLLELKKIECMNSNKDQVITSYKPPIFWKEKDMVKKQMSEWSEEEIKKKIYKLTDLEILIKSNTTGINLISDFVSNY